MRDRICRPDYHACLLFLEVVLTRCLPVTSPMPEAALFVADCPSMSELTVVQPWLNQRS